jgi:hypothetical protein
MTTIKRIFNLHTVASGAAIGMIVAGALAIVGGLYAKDVVHDQLVPQKIFFPAKGEQLPASLNQYAGQQVDTGKEAKAFADDYIALHLSEVAGGKTYSEVSAAWMQDQGNEKLAQQRQTLFMGETLRGMLLNAWGWGTVGTVALIAGSSLIGIGFLLLLVPMISLVAARRRSTAEVDAPAAAPASA